MESKEVYLKHPELFPAGRAPQSKPRADEGPFMWISEPGKHTGWDAVASEPESRPLNTYPQASAW